MGLFDKVKNKGKAEEQEDLSMDFPISGVMNDQDEDEELPTLDALVGGSMGLDVDVKNPETEKAVLDQSLGLLDDTIGVGAPSGAGDELAVLDGDSGTQPSDGLDDLGDLMDIFTSEEEENVDLTALLSDLEEVPAQELLVLALEVSEGLRLLYSEVD